MSDLHVFRNLIENHGENAFTEALASNLRASRIFRQGLLSLLGCSDATCQVETQKFYREGKPDILISSPKTFALIEVKWDAPLSYSQWMRYEKILYKRHEKFKILTSIVSPSTKVEKRIFSKGPRTILKWPDVYTVALNAVQREKHPVAHFLLTELIDLLESHGMKPFDRFSASQTTALKELYGTLAKLGVFFGEVLVLLNQQIATQYKRKVVIEDLGFKVDTWKGHPDIYAGNDMYISYDGLMLWGWVGCHFSQQGPVFELYMGDDRCSGLKKDTIREIFRNNEFEFDAEEREYDSYYRPLLSKIDAPAQTSLAAGTSREIREILLSLLAGLKSKKRASEK